MFLEESYFEEATSKTWTLKNLDYEKRGKQLDAKKKKKKKKKKTIRKSHGITY